MATALDILKRSLRMLGVYSIGEEPSADESQDGLSALNPLMGMLTANGALVYAKTLDTIAVAPGTASLTVGPSGGTVTTRPAEVLAESYITISTMSYPLAVFTLQQYTDKAIKTQAGIPEGIFCQMDMPNITVTFWPVPSATATLSLYSNKLITSFANLTDVVSLPPGWEDGLAYLLAEAIAPEYEVEIPVSVQRGCNRARYNLAHYEPPMLTTPPELTTGMRFNILTGTSR